MIPWNPCVTLIHVNNIFSFLNDYTYFIVFMNTFFHVILLMWIIFFHMWFFLFSHDSFTSTWDSFHTHHLRFTWFELHVIPHHNKQCFPLNYELIFTGDSFSHDSCIFHTWFFFYLAESFLYFTFDSFHIINLFHVWFSYMTHIFSRDSFVYII